MYWFSYFDCDRLTKTYEFNIEFFCDAMKSKFSGITRRCAMRTFWILCALKFFRILRETNRRKFFERK